MLLALNLYSDVYQLFLKKTQKKHFEIKEKTSALFLSEYFWVERSQKEGKT